MSKKEKKEITKYMNSINLKFFTLEEAEIIEDYVLYHYMGIVKRPNIVYSLEYFNAYLDDNNLNDLPRFFERKHDPRKFLEDGSINPNYNKGYWRVI